MKRTKISTQTTRLNGAKVKLVTGANGKITIKEAPIDEWELQAEAVRRLRQLPEYAANANKVGANSFTIAGDMNAGRRSLREQTRAKATGLPQAIPIFASTGQVGGCCSSNTRVPRERCRQARKSDIRCLRRSATR